MKLLLRMVETDSRSIFQIYRVLRPCVSLYTPENYTLQSKCEKLVPLFKYTSQTNYGVFKLQISSKEMHNKRILTIYIVLQDTDTCMDGIRIYLHAPSFS